MRTKSLPGAADWNNYVVLRCFVSAGCNAFRFFLFAEDDKVAPADFVEEQIGRLILDGIDASGYRFAPMPSIEKQPPPVPAVARGTSDAAQAEGNDNCSSQEHDDQYRRIATKQPVENESTHDNEWARWSEDYERRRQMESHVTNFLKHPQVYGSKLANFLEQRCNVTLWPVPVPRSDLQKPLGILQVCHDRQHALRSDLDWWEGGYVGGRVRVRGVGTSFPRAVQSGPLWSSSSVAAEQHVGDDCTATVAPRKQLCRL